MLSVAICDISVVLNINLHKKNHWFQISASKLLGDKSGDNSHQNTKQIFWRKFANPKTEKVSITIEFYIFELA